MWCEKCGAEGRINAETEVFICPNGCADFGTEIDPDVPPIGKDGSQ